MNQQFSLSWLARFQEILAICCSLSPPIKYFVRDTVTVNLLRKYSKPKIIFK
jgi:hypothetical protein